MAKTSFAGKSDSVRCGGRCEGFGADSRGVARSQGWGGVCAKPTNIIL